MTIPNFQEVMLPLLTAAAGREVGISGVVESLATHFGLTSEERAHLLPGGKQETFANRVHWAGTYLVKAGLLDRTRRCHVRATQRGLDEFASKLPHIRPVAKVV